MMFGYWGEGGGVEAKGIRAHAQVGLCMCKCSTGSVHMLNWKRVHAQPEVCTCQLERAHAEVYTSLPESVRMINCKRAHAQL